MIEWIRSPVWLNQAFDAAVPDGPAVERGQMFGYPAAFVGGNMAAGLFQEHVIVRLSEARRATLLAEPGSAPFEPMPGRTMKEYVVVSPAIVADARALRLWIGEALTYAAALPPKAKKKAPPAKRTTRAKKAAPAKAAGKTKKKATKKGPKRATKKPTKKPRR